MSTSVIEPGTRLAGRYRLEERISDSGGSSLWKAIDEILARAVAVRTFEPGFPRVGEVVTSARAASRLTDPRLTQVFDADDSGESAYVVSEWVVGETLEQMLAKAPLEPGRAATLLYEASEAITAAHASGLAHLCLTPRDLVWTTGGTVKVLGIATDAVLGDRYYDDPAAEDVRGLGRLLYAALTAHWPGAADEPASRRSDLPAAPSTDGVFHAPRQVQAGISHGIDAIVCRCLGIPGQEPLATPADLAKALRGVPRTPLPLFAGLGGTPSPQRPAPSRPRAQAATAATAQQPPPQADPRARRRERGDAYPAQPPQHGHAQQNTAPPHPQQTRAQHAGTSPPGVPGTHAAPGGGRPGGGRPGGGRPGGGRPGGNRALLGVAAAALTVIIGLGAWALRGDGDGKDGDGKDGKGGPGQQSQSAVPAPANLKIHGAVPAEDPIDGHLDDAIGKKTGAVHDGRTSTVWETQTYRDVNFGKFSKGLGVVLDMGAPVTVKSVKVAAPDGGGTLEVRVGDSQGSPTALRFAGRGTGVSGETTINIGSRAVGRYVLVWYVKLPPSAKGKISEVNVFGTR